ncbi:segregation and condensation protein B [Fructobacillus pseudoficulneus]|uniref:Segregation and condensation protein B n=1 Tax=Fructobacillus pseudoficulneus TaxID=220714 RepID=A0A3F3H716_9LACO|nr:SMC-Scp complex subunit ScpB [Fructobacillus pseudoficulneus]GAP02589.1 segregation and condensation protein B [Fructobacillus pseudoficulneus]SEH38402.1 segregation and condensation protein B [Fructobacillus pseudoficulneus]
MDQKISQIEALLFVAGEDGLTAAELAKITGFDKGAIPGLIDKLATHLIEVDSPLTLRSSDDRYVIVTKPEFGKLVSAYFDLPVNTKLTQPQLETLVIIAYQQPITRVEIDQIRGVRSAGTIQKLLLHQLIEAVGRKEEIGRPILYGTTADFLDYFGLKSLEELPELPDINDLTLDETGQAEVALFDQIDDQGDTIAVADSAAVPENQPDSEAEGADQAAATTVDSEEQKESNQ